MDDAERRARAGIRSMDEDDEPERGLNPRLQPTNLQAPEIKQGWGSKFGAAVDSTISQGYGIAEAMGVDSAREGRLNNAAAARATNEMADAQLGIAGSWDEAHGVGGTAKYLASQGINSLPMMAATTGATMVNPALGAATAYGFALGDTLENQRDQSGGTNLGAGMATALPYAAADYALGIQGKITRGLAARGIVKEAVEQAPSRINLLGRAEHALEGAGGVKGFAGRRALEFGKTAAEEAGSETFQEGMNQLSRMSVDDSAGFLDDDALARYKESAIVGGLLGGAVGGVTGGKYGARAAAPKEEETKGNTPIGEKGTPEMLQLGWNGHLDSRSLPNNAPGAPAQIGYDGVPATQQLGWNGQRGLGEEGTGGVMTGEGSNLPGSAVAPQAAQAVSRAFPTPASPEEQVAQRSQEQDIEDARQHAEAVQKLTERAAKHGIDEKNALLFGALEGALHNKLIDRASWVVGVGNLASGNKQLIADTKKAIAALEAQHELNQKAQPEAAGGLQLGPAVPAGAAPATEAPAGAQAPAPAPAEEAAAQRAVAEVKERLSPGKVITAAAMKKKGGKPISPLLRRRLYQRMGLDDEGWPRAEKRTLAEIAQIEADEAGQGKLEGKELEKKARAIQTMLAGHGFPAKIIDNAIDAMTDQGHGLDTRSIAVNTGDELTADQLAGTGAETSTPQLAEGEDVEDQTDFDEGSAPAEPKTTEEMKADEERGEDYAGTGMGVKSSVTSSADRENTVAFEFRQLARDLSKAPDLSDAQRELFSNASNLPWKQRVEAIEALISNEELFSAPEREMFSAVFEEGRSSAAENARDETVEEAREIANTNPAAEAALAARNIEQIAKNAREDAAKAQRAASLARQVEEMDAGDALLDALPAEMHEDIEGAAKEWEEYAGDGAPGWHGLATDLQAQWVKGFSQSLDMTAQKSQDQRVAVSEAVSRRAIGRQESAAAAADRAAADTEAAIAAAQQRDELRSLAEKQDAEEKAKAERKTARERKVGTTVVRTKKGKLNATNTQADGGAGGTVADVGQGAQGTERQASGRGEGGNGAPNERAAAQGTGQVDQAGSQAPVAAERPAAPDVDTTHGDWTGVVTTAPLMAEPPAGRTPSVRVALRRANKDVVKGKITEAEALARVTEAAEEAAAMDAEKRSNADLVRDADHTRAQLLEGRRSGDLDPDLVELADWFIRKNPHLVRGLAISIKGPRKDRRGNELPGPVGTYESMRRIMTLIKGKANALTAVHEILHHAERMMPRPLREALTKAWIKALFRAKRRADAGTDENLKKFFDALMYYHFDEASKYGAAHPEVALNDAMKLLTSGKVSANLYYQYVNSSEFWAVNGSRIVQGRFAGSEGVSNRIKAWMREFVQKLKGMVGMQSDAPIIKALDSLAKGDGKFLTGTMLSQGSGVGGVHNMYVGPQALDQEKQAQLAVAENMAGTGKTPAEIHMATGWFLNPFDKKWRYEVSDDAARLKREPATFKLGAGNYKLSDVLDHPELFKRYPALANVKMHFFEGGAYERYDGFYSPPENTIGLNRSPQGDMTDTLIHEIQHWVQHKEGFAQGSSSGSIAYELNDAQAIEVGQKVADENRRDLEGFRRAEQRTRAFISHPMFPALMAAEDQAHKDMRNAAGYKGRSGLPNKKALATNQRAIQIADEIAADTLGMELDALVGSPSYDMIRAAIASPSVAEAWNTLRAYEQYTDEYEANIEKAAAGDREQITRLGMNSSALHEAYTRSAGELEAEESASRRGMDADFRTYFAPFPMSDTGVAPQDAVVSMAPPQSSAREQKPGERKPDDTTRAYKPQDRTVLGRAIPLNPATTKTNMSSKAEKLLRAGHADGSVNPEATQAIKAALRQIARDIPELAKAANLAVSMLPEKGIALRVDGTQKLNVHGYVDFKGQPTMHLMTAEGREGLTPATFVHEALHAVIGARYYMLQYGMAENNYTKLGVPKPQAMEALKDFKTFYDEFNKEVVAFVKEQGGNLSKVDPGLRSSLTEAGQNPDELFVRALSDPALQEWMSKREYKGQSLLAKFKNWVARNLFNISTGERPSWLDAAMTASNTLAKASKADAPDWGMHQAMQQRLGAGRAGEAVPDSVTNRVIDEYVTKLPPKLQPGAKFGLRALTNGAKRGVSFITTTEDMVRIVEKAMPAARRYSDKMRAIVFDRQHRQLAAEAILRDSKNLAPGQREKASNFLRDSTLAKKWGYKPAYVKDAVVDPEMERRFNALLPETRKLVKEVFEQGNKDLTEMRAAVTEAAEVASAGDEEKKNRAIAKFDRLMGLSGAWPYAPLSRFGDFTAVGRSAEFRALEERLKADPKNKALREQHEAMEIDPDHYEVRFAETEAHAQAIADDMRGRFPEDHVEHFARDKTQVMGAGGDMFAAVARLRNLAADSEFSETSARTLQKLVNDLHLSLLSERSARQSDRSRKGIAGFNDDMWRNFGSRAKANAHFLASTKATGEVQNVLAQLKREANVTGTVEGMDRAERSKYYNEFMRRHMAEMEWRPTSWVDNAMATTSFWKLLSSPSYLLMNLTQPWVMSAPVIAGRHGIPQTINAIGKAYAELVPLVKAGELAPGRFKNLPKDVQAGIDALIKQGLISVSLDGDLGKYGEGNNPVTKGLKMTGDFLSDLSTKTEDLNRLATAIAALRLERAKGATPEAAIKYAGKILYDTHGDYSGFNSPPWMRSKFGRLVSQFRKFQMIQVGLWFKLANDAFVGKGLTKEERWAAMKSFGYSLGTMGALGGVMALPGATAITFALGAAFGDPDEPNDPEAAMRRWIGDEDLANLILKGVPARLGIDLSSRLGAGDMLSVLPNSDPELSKEGVTRMVFKALGPAVGAGADAVDGMAMMMRGDWWKGLEKIAPRGLSDAAKGARLATQGFTNNAGETTLSADDVGVMSGVLQAVGLPTSTLSERGRGVSEKYKSDKFYIAQQAGAKRAYSDAVAAGDTQAMREAREGWTRMQDARKRLGYQPSPLSDLLKAPAERAKREKQSIGGIQYRGKRDEGAARQLAEL